MESIVMSKKDRVTFTTKSNHGIPSKYDLPPPLPNEQRRGVILPNGEINWNCPCLGGLPYGPCGFEFREFFSCMHKFDKDKNTENADTIRTQECFPKMVSMRDCFVQFPKLYPLDVGDDQVESTTDILRENESSDPKSEPSASQGNK